MTKKLTTEQFIQKAKLIHGEEYDYSQVAYVNSITKVQIVCLIHGAFIQLPTNHIHKNRKVGCPKCGRDRFKQKKTFTTSQFIAQARLIHGDKYDYSGVEYIHNTIPVKIQCLTHGVFTQRAINHLQGYGCRRCANDQARGTLADFISRSVDIHGDAYNYSHVQYTRTDIPVYIECKIHGMFVQTPNSHLSGCGCPHCGVIKTSIAVTLNTPKFIHIAQQLHGDLYDYSTVKYVNTRTKVSIKCKKHGIFHQQPNMHLQGQRCPRCKGNISILESHWLDYCHVPNTSSTRQCNIFIGNKRYKVDGYIPETNTIYEFWGDFWHGNPAVFKLDGVNLVNKKTYRELYQSTAIKRQEIINAGYNLVEVWEYDWIRSIKTR